MIILVGGEKGGTGKSTIATNLAIMLMRSGRDVLVVDADDQETVRFLSGILRIAIGLDRTHDGRTTSVKITRKQDDLQIAVLGKRGTDHELNIYAAHERRELLQDALHCTIALTTKR